MDFPGLRPLSLLITLVSGLFFQSPGLAASQKMNQMPQVNEIERALASGGMEMTGSMKERMLKNFQKERQELYKNRGKEPHLFKNRLKILNGKIDFLENEVRRMKPRVKPAAVAAKPAMVRSVAPVTVPAKPAAVPVVKLKPGLKGYAPPESRKRHFLAMKPNIVSLKSLAQLDGRVGPQEATMLQRVEERAPAVVEKRQEPQKEVLEPLPAKVEAPTPVVAPMKAKNKTLKIGSDWIGMSLPDKEIYILSVMGNLSKRDVYLMRPYSYYIQSIDEAIEKSPDLGEEYVHRILMMTAYESEPESRKDLEKVWK